MSTKIRQLLRTAPSAVRDEIELEGWTVERTRNSHFRWLHPSGAIVISSSSPSDHRHWANHLSRLRRARSRSRTA
jgi:predicted RNA binding protein YcfA (HicA-like mRNA interferase family)